MELFSPEDLERAVYSVFYRARTQGVDSRTDSPVPVDPGTGLPTSASDVMSLGHSTMGEELVYKIRCYPFGWATVFGGLVHTKREFWTREEASWVSETTSRIKHLIRRGVEEGHFVDRPVSLYDGNPMPMGIDGFAVEAAITPKGLRHATDICVGTKFERGGVSILADAPAHIIANAPQWARDKFKHEIK